MQRPRPSQVVIATGLGVLLVGGVLVGTPWYEAARWQSSPEAARAVRNAEAPAPIWLTPTPVTSVAAEPTKPPTSPVAPVAQAVPTRTPRLSPPVALQANIDPAATPTPSVSDLQLGATAFVFDDPPEPGAHAHLSLTVHNPTERASEQITLALPLAWLAGYRVESTSPAPVDGNQADGALRLSFGGPAARSDLEVSVSVVTTDEVIDAPTVTVYDADRRAVGKSHPTTQAPPPRPGPIYSIDIPRLHLHTGVVPVDWEPPLFVVGQVRTSAYVTLGNSVLVGHLRGAAGYNVFDHLDQLGPGDQVIASSRGQVYTFVVTQTQVLPEDDTSPTQPTHTPRLTLMTCAGDWNPIARDYSERLWVTAEPASAALPARGTD